MANPLTTEQLLKKLDAERDAYINTFLQLHEGLAQSIILQNVPTSPVSATSPTSAPRNLALDRVARLSVSEGDRKAAQSFVSTFKDSLISSGDGEFSDDDEALYVQDILPSASVDDEHLHQHLRCYDWTANTKQILGYLMTRDGRMKYRDIFAESPALQGDQCHYSLYQVFDVGSDGAPLELIADRELAGLNKSQAMWHFVKSVNGKGKQRQAVGRITILREPSPPLFAAIHLAMHKIFDMDEIFADLVEQKTTNAYMYRAYSDDLRKAKSFVFSFEYFTIIGDECVPMPWQQSDKERTNSDNHIPISRCSSVVALALIGDPIRKMKNNHRRAKTEYVHIYSPWSPWHVLNIQCYPDWKSTIDSHDSTKHYVNGPDAFLNTLLVEYKDAQKRFEEISQRVTKLVTPPADFMFNLDLRDKLLFEDGDFTYSRRYFWAFQTLGTMNHSIKAMIDAYEDTFTDDVWEGRHKTLWPLVEDNSGRNAYWRKRMAALKKDFTAEIDALKVILKENEDRRKEIRNLRDNLFSGTSVLESRKSVEQTEITVQQGHNIKLLTLVNMFFLPLTFVTSVFGMTNMDPTADFLRFGVVMATVCVPFFLLIGSMNTSRGMRFWKDQFGRILVNVFAILSWTQKKTPRSSSTTSPNDIDGMTRSMQPRSMSASEGIARRTGRRMTKAATLSLRKSATKDKKVETQQEGTANSGKTPASLSSDVIEDDETRTQTNSVQSPSSPPSIRAHPTDSSLASRNGTARGIIEKNAVEPNGTTVQRYELGIWDRLRTSKTKAVSTNVEV